MEALKVIASAWSTAFIVACILTFISGDTTSAAYVLPFAVTGAGWLWHRMRP